MSAATAAATATLAPVRPRRMVRMAGRLVVSVLVVSILGVVAVALVLPLVTGGAARAVRTGSMAPTLPVGSLILDRPVDAHTLRVGDIATYVRSDNELVTHRIVAVDHRAGGLSFVFRGDANRTADPVPVTAANIRGKVWFHVPLLGTVGERLAQARWVFIGIAVLVLAAYAVRQAAGGLRELRQDR
jgi:signal peptidase